MLENHAYPAAHGIGIFKMVLDDLLHQAIVSTALVRLEQVFLFDFHDGGLIVHPLGAQSCIGIRCADHIPVQIGVGRGDEFALDPDFAVGRLFQEVDRAQQRRFSAARRPDDGDDIPLLDVQAHAAQHMQRAEILV